MYLYLIFSILAFSTFFEINFGKKRTKRIMIIPVILFFLLASLRWERGTDWTQYRYIFENIDIEFYHIVFEFLFVKYNELVRYFTSDYTWMLVAQAIIIYSTVYYIIRKYSPLPLLSLLVWFSTFFASIFFTRQAVAVSIIILSYHFIVRRKLIYFLLLVLVASLYHRSAIIFIPAYWIYNLKFSRKQMIIFFGIALLFSFVTQILLDYFSLLDFGMFSEKSAAYSEIGSDESFNSSYSPLQTMIRGLSYRLALVVVFIIFFYKNYLNDKIFRGFFNIYYTSIILFVLFVPVSVALIRFSIFYDQTQFFFYAFLVVFVKDKRIKNLFLFLLILYLLFRLYSNIGTYEDLFVPYKSIFNKSLEVEVG